ncbi:MAG TPA: hypothetical protein VF884_08955 [Nitrososphaeraceae archaeon]
MKNEYFKIVEGLKSWLQEKLRVMNMTRRCYKTKLITHITNLTVAEKTGLAVSRIGKT